MKYAMILLLTLILTSNAKACILQDDFLSSFTLSGKYLNIEIQRKDGKKFKYYTIEPVGEDIFIGFHFNDKRKIDFRTEKLKRLPIGSPSLVPDDEGTKSLTEEQLKSIREFFYQPYDISFFMQYKKVSQRYYIPLREYYEVLKYTNKIDLENFISYNKVILDENHIKGIQRIKFYVKFLHNQIPIECSYFESPTIELDLDTIKGYNYH